MEYKIQPWRHQLEAIERAREMAGFALFFEMGAGKTGTTINILRDKFNSQRRVLRTLILCPPIVVPNWRDEWAKHSQLPPERVVLLRGAGKARAKLFKSRAWDEQGKPQGVVFVTNYESLLMQDLYELFKRWAPEAIVFDESHKLKDPKAKRSKLADDLANGDHNPRFRYILSGSPVLNSPMDLFMQYLVLDGGTTFGRNFFAFRARYFRDRNAGMPKDRYFPDWQLRAGSEAEISAAISATGMRVLKQDCLDLPPMVRQVVRVPLAPEQARLYKEMKRDFVTFMGDKAVTAVLAMTKAMRLMQIASGYIKTTEGEEIALEETPKMAALKELLSELTPNHKVLIWAVWKKNYAEIKKVCDDLAIRYVEVHGGISDTGKQNNVRTFCTDSDCRVLIGHPGSGGIGINLVVASYAIFYSRTFSLEQSLQAEARNHRGGSEIHEKITRIDLVCEDTIDELVSEKLANKQEIGDKVLRDLSLEIAKQEN
jgi:SNF2 family DNA or RNA helicase